MNRRSFLTHATTAGTGLLAAPKLSLRAKTTQTAAQGHFTVARQQGRWWFLTPERKRFFSLGLNHVDPATLRYPENIGIWREKYGNSMRRWLTDAVGPNLRDWGFNSLGWNQEVITRGPTNHRHSRHFTRDEYDWLGMPYCHQLPFADFHQWEAETRHPDFFAAEFADWCDHVAREHCVPLADDPNLIGYFYIDCPCWLHVRDINEWKGPLFDPELAQTPAGRTRLRELAGKWYQVTHDAIRRHDPHHLILGDRYEANAPLTMDIIEAARPFVDVLSFQDFRDPVGHLEQWHRDSGLPVLWADGAKSRRIPEDPRNGKRNDGAWYAAVLAGLRRNPGVVGAHLCGAYYRNRVRGRGLLDEDESPDTENIALIRRANRDTETWVRSFD